MQLNVRVNGLTRVVNKLNGIERGKASALRDASNQTNRYLKSEIPPPPPPTSTYVRTGRLETSFKGSVTPISRGYAVSISNPTKYAPWVISLTRVAGAGPQAWMHRGRWYTLQEVLRRSANGVVQIYAGAIRRLVEQ